MSGPQERVRAYLDWRDENNAKYPNPGDWRHIEDEIDSRGSLGNFTHSDIRDTLNELDEHQRFIEQVDETLDQLNGFNDAEVLSAVLRLFGNHTKEES